MHNARRVLLTGLLILLCGFAPGASIASFDGATGWINSPVLHPGDLRGKVVLVDFWEYTCLNCLRTLPYLREWYKRYHNDGFTIVGVHTPEFAFSSQTPQIESAAKRLGIDWPIAVDSNLTIWKRYGINLWPTELLFDQSGRLVDAQYGEGNYPQTEAKIQALLHAADPALALPPVMPLLPQDNYDKPGAVCYPHTPEILIGQTPIADATAFGDPAKDLEYDDSGKHRDGAIYLSGYWHMTRDAAAFGGGRGYFDLAYHAIEVAVVMTPGSGSSRVIVTQDGKPLAREDAGADVHYDDAGNAYIEVDAARAYHVVENAVYGAHDLRLAPAGFGVAFYDVAFESCEVPGAR